MTETVTSKSFISLTATGTNWRDVTRDLLAGVKDKDDDHNLGFLYVSDSLAGDMKEMLDLIRAVTGIEHWVGATGIGVCGTGVSHIDTPAAAMMLGRFPKDSFAVFPATDLTMIKAREALDPWLDAHDVMLTLVHGDPMADTDPELVLAELERLTGGFIAGGLSSSRTTHNVIADSVATAGIGGVAFSSDIAVATTLTQGCAPLGPLHTITRAEGNVIVELDGQRAFEIFADDLKNMALSRSGEDSSGSKIAATLLQDDFADMDRAIKNLFRGDIHVAFPVTGSDRRDYTVRNIVGLDPDDGLMAVPHHIEPGQHIMFVHRDADTVQKDLVFALGELRDRLIRENGQCAPQGAIYVSCVARAQSGAAGGFGGPDGEMRLIHEVLGDVPLAGFYANGEISNRRLYGYTGVLILFL